METAMGGMQHEWCFPRDRSCRRQRSAAHQAPAARRCDGANAHGRMLAHRSASFADGSGAFFEPASFGTDCDRRPSAHSAHGALSRHHSLQLPSFGSRAENWRLEGNVLIRAESASDPARECWAVDFDGRPSDAFDYMRHLSENIDPDAGRKSSQIDAQLRVRTRVDPAIAQDALSTVSDEDEVASRAAVDYLRRTGSAMQDAAQRERRTFRESRPALELDRVGDLPLRLETRHAVELRRCVSACVMSTEAALHPTQLRESRRALEVERLEILPLHLATRPALDVERDSAPLKVQLLSRSASQKASSHVTRHSRRLQKAASIMASASDARQHAELKAECSGETSSERDVCRENPHLAYNEPAGRSGISRLWSSLGRSQSSAGQSEEHGTCGTLPREKHGEESLGGTRAKHSDSEQLDSIKRTKLSSKLSGLRSEKSKISRHFSRRDAHTEEVRRVALEAVARANQSSGYECRDGPGSSCSSELRSTERLTEPLTAASGGSCSSLDSGIAPPVVTKTNSFPARKISRLLKQQRNDGFQQFVSRADGPTCCRNIALVVEPMNDVALYVKRSQPQGDARANHMRLEQHLCADAFARTSRTQSVSISVEVTSSGGTSPNRRSTISLRLTRALDRVSPSAAVAFTALCNAIASGMFDRDPTFARL